MKYRLKVPVISRIAVAVLVVCLLAGTSSSQTRSRTRNAPGDSPKAEFHLARLVYGTASLSDFRGFFNNNWWAIDYPQGRGTFFARLASRHEYVRR
jgi:hypothetical protein